MTAATAIQAALHAANMITEVCTTGAGAIGQKERFRPDVLLIDLDLPDVSGFTLVEQFAAAGDCGVIVVSAFGDELTRIAGLETGADDYIVKPPVLRELAARIRAVNRRIHRRGSSASLDDVPMVTLPPHGATAANPGQTLAIDHVQRCLIGPTGERTLLTEAELSVLDTLIDAKGASVSREWLSRVALKRPLHSDDRSVDQLVLKLRRKIASHGQFERVILSARRQGYVIMDPTIFRIVPAPGAETRPKAASEGPVLQTAGVQTTK